MKQSSFALAHTHHVQHRHCNVHMNDYLKINTILKLKLACHSATDISGSAL